MKVFKTLIIMLLIVCGTLFANDAADAAQVIEKTTNIVSGPTVGGGKVGFTVGGNVKLVRHAKALSSSFAPTVATGGTKATTRITRFEYGCPGYYTTRLYSDVAGTKLIGYVQVYVSTSDINKSGCEPVQAPPTVTPPKPPAPQPTHPDPIKVETLTPAPQPAPQKYETKLEENEPEIIEIPPTPEEPEPMTWQQYCTQLDAKVYAEYGQQYKHIPMPEAEPGEVYAPCCPTGQYSGTYEIFNISNLNDSDYYAISGWVEWKNMEFGDWRCGVLHVDIEETYCARGQIYDSASNQCKVSSDTNRLSYEQPLYNSSGISAIDDDIPLDPEPEPEPEPEPTNPEPEPTNPEPTDPTDPTIVEGVIQARFCVMDNGDYAVLLGPTAMALEDLMYLSKSEGVDYYLDPPGSESSVFADYVTNRNMVVKKDAINFSLELFRDNTGHGEIKKLSTGKITNADFNGAVECAFDGEPTETEGEQPQQPIDCNANPQHEECLPDCYCPTLDGIGQGLGFMCCVWDCPGLEEIISDFKSYLSNDLVGTATAPPVPNFEPPSVPDIFENFNDVDVPKQEPITTTEDPQLGTSSFTADDVKDAAGEIQFQEDETGGFNIVNPLETLPEDGSSAPRPDNNTYNDTATPPSYNGSTAKPPSYSGDTVQPPSYSGTATTPTYDGQIETPKLD